MLFEAEVACLEIFGAAPWGPYVLPSACDQEGNGWLLSGTFHMQ